MPQSAAPRPAASPSAPLPTGFDRVAWCYDALAALVFGPALRNTQRAALAGLPAGTPRVLILGGGTGWVLAEVLRRRPAARVLYLEASARMLGRARARLAPPQRAQVEFRHGTQDALVPAEQFDAIVTFFVLDCIELPTLPAALDRLARALAPAGRWLLADFGPATGGWRRALHLAMFGFFRITTGLRPNFIADFAGELRARGLRAERVGTFYGGAAEALILHGPE